MGGRCVFRYVPLGVKMKRRSLVIALTLSLGVGLVSSTQAGNPLAPALWSVPDYRGRTGELPQMQDLQLNTYRSVTARHKYRVPFGSPLRRVAAADATVDYESFSLVMLDVASATQSAAAGAELADYMNLMLLNSGVIDTTSPAAQALVAKGFGDDGTTGMALVQFVGPIRPQWLKELDAADVSIVTPIPSNAYLVYGRNSALRQLASVLRMRIGNALQFAAAYGADQRIDPAARGQDAVGGKLSVQLFGDEAVNAETIELLRSLSNRVVSDHAMEQYRNLVVEVGPGVVEVIAARPDVVSVQAYATPIKRDERQNRIITGQLTGASLVAGSHLQWLANHGFTQAQFDSSGFVVNLSDSGVDNGTPSANHFGLHKSGDIAQSSRITYNRLVGTANGGSTLAGADGHGTINSHIIGGYVGIAAPFNAAPHQDASGYHYGLGVAPFVKIGSSVIFDPDNYTNPNVLTLESQAYADGARISSNSWGSASNSYSVESQSYDKIVRDAQSGVAGAQPMVVVFAAGNGGSGANTVGEPATAKNVISVGASENVQPFGGADGCGVTDAQANSALDIIGFSSRGPTSDGRKKPDIMAPGTHITGGVWQSALNNPALVSNGSAAAGYLSNGGGVCGGVSGAAFFPGGGQQWYTASSGTSHSTPAIAGAAALVRQWFLNHGQPAPSPALTKGLMTATTRYMTGTGANDTLPSNNQGLGLLDLDRAFDATPRLISDQDPVEMFTASGQSRLFTGKIADPTQPLRIALTWTDAYGPTNGAAYVNDLDLEVVINGNTYKGNVFSGGNSTTGGVRDQRNNLESVFLPSGFAVDTPVLIRVTGMNIPGDGVPGNVTNTDQDFALFAYNLQETFVPFVTLDTVDLVAENGVPANGLPDPGETVTYSLGLRNIGNSATTDVVADLQPGGGVESPSVAQSYGAMPSGGNAVTRNFTFHIDANRACGATLTPTWNLSDDGEPLGSVSASFTLGGISAPAFALTENFDAVTAPALPVDWTQTKTGGGGNWRTNTTTPDSVPNAAFVDDPTSTSDKKLVSPDVVMPAVGDGHLKFRHRYDLEGYSSDTTRAYDGVVLEVSIDGGAFQDILASGGTFVTGAYNRTVDSNTNALDGRPVWSGNSAAYQDVEVSLPASMTGHTLKFQWRLGSDSSVGKTGYRLDNVNVFTDQPECAAVPPLPSVALTVDVHNGRKTLTAGGQATYLVHVVNAGPDAAVDATVNVPLPVGVASMGWTCIGTGGAACAASGNGAIAELVDIPVGDSLMFTITADIGQVEQLIEFSAAVTKSALADESDTTDNTAVDSDPIVLFADDFEELSVDE